MSKLLLYGGCCCNGLCRCCRRCCWNYPAQSKLDTIGRKEDTIRRKAAPEVDNLASLFSFALFSRGWTNVRCIHNILNSPIVSLSRICYDIHDISIYTYTSKLVGGNKNVLQYKWSCPPPLPTTSILTRPLALAYY